MSYIQGYDSESLREIVDPSACRQRLEDIGSQRSLPALLERVWLLKVLGELDESVALSEQSVRVARMAGTRKDLLRSRILHASVLTERGAYEAADAELSTCAEEADGQEWPSIAAFALSHRGRERHAAGDAEGARSDFKRVLFLRQELGASEDELELAMTMIEATERRRSAVSAG
ncbi:hypothetical protein [Microbacterium halophytorum]|uniref:hypothetical protein n=1 Tax=Microbacterium halophytorum TaxID=2067568 RepID=UPI000CFC4EE4|nr:hypothetical protein [Microbacterium halophytorum]